MKRIVAIQALGSSSGTFSVTDVSGTPTERDAGRDAIASINGAKATVDAIYLIPRLGEKLDVRDLNEVRGIAAVDGGYAVEVRDLKSGATRSYRAPRVIVAAGTMNTVKLMCEAEAAGSLKPMPALGLKFGTNGDFSGTWEPGGERDSTLGTSAHGRIYYDGAERGSDVGVFTTTPGAMPSSTIRVMG